MKVQSIGLFFCWWNVFRFVMGFAEGRRGVSDYVHVYI